MYSVNKLLLSIIIIMLVSPLIIADEVADELGYFRINENITLVQVCDDCTFVNITSIKYPNSTLQIINQPMTKTNQEFTYGFNNTDLIGEYFYTACGDVGDTTYTCESVLFTITNSGYELSTGESIIYIIFLLASLFTFSLCLFFSIKIPFKNQRSQDGTIISINDMKYLKIFLIVMSYIVLMFIFGIVRSITANYLSINGAYRLFNFLFYMMFSFVWPLIVVSLILTVVLYLSSKRLQKALERGVPMR